MKTKISKAVITEEHVKISLVFFKKKYEPVFNKLKVPSLSFFVVFLEDFFLISVLLLLYENTFVNMLSFFLLL